MSTLDEHESAKGLNVEQYPVDASVLTTTELQSLETGLRTLWERVRQAGGMIAQLREEKTSLKNHVQGLEAQILGLDQELLKREGQIKELVARKVVLEPKEGFVLANGEREALTSRLKDLLARIDAYL